MSRLRRLKPGLERLYETVDGQYRDQILELVPIGSGLRLLDVGCDDGVWTDRLRQQMGISAENVMGIEMVEARAALGRERGFDVRSGDLEAAWPFADESFDVVHANQVIEHVKRLDHFVGEIGRVLRPGGAAVVCTENLASWHNVGALVLGYMPFSLTNVSATGAIGNPWGLHVDEPSHEGESWQHVHVLTLVGLRSIFEAHGFGVERVFAAGYYPAPPRLGLWFARRDPRHAHFIGIVARRSV